MDESVTEDPIDGFTLELLRSGCVLAELAADLIESLPDDAYPGEANGDVVIGMMSGTIRTFLDEVDDADVARATELIAGAVSRVIEHLELALAMRRQLDARAGEG
jgi:hypothetical protein